MRKTLILSAAVALALSSAACTKKEEAITTPAGTTAASAGSSTTKAEAPGTTEGKKKLSKTDFLKKADEICKKAADEGKKNNPEPTASSTEEEQLAYVEAALKAQQKQLATLRELGDPAEGAADWNEGLDNIGDALKRLEEVMKDSSLTAAEMAGDAEVQKLISAANAAAKKFGLKECGKGSSDSSTSSSAPKNTTTTKEKSGGGAGAAAGSTVTVKEMQTALVKQGASAALAACVTDLLYSQDVPLKPDADLTTEEAAAYAAAGAECKTLENDGELGGDESTTTTEEEA